MEENFLDRLAGDTGALKDVVARLMELRYKMMCAEDEYKRAQKEYSDFAIKEIPSRFSLAGVSSMTLEDGRKIEVVSKARASVIKEKAGNVAKWLREHKAEDLITTTYAVPDTYLPLLKQNNIAYDTKVDMNTNSIKRLVKEMLDGGIISQSELPDGLSWFQWNEAEVK